MDMATHHPEQGLFHLTGSRSGAGLSTLDTTTLRPALLAAYGDLNRLRHDYPLVLTHANGLQPSADVNRIYRNQREHDPLDLNAAREIASCEDPIPVGILYHNPEIPCYEDLRHAGAPRSPALTRAGLEAELDKYTIWPERDNELARAA